MDYRPREDFHQVVSNLMGFRSNSPTDSITAGSTPRSTPEKSLSMILLQTFPMEWVLAV